MKAKIKNRLPIKASKGILQDGTGTPYIALFSKDGMPIMNKLTSIPLGAYLSSFYYKSDESDPNEADLTFDVGNPDTVDQEELQVNKDIWIQWGYIYSDGTSISNTPKSLKIKDFDILFDDSGTHCTLKCADGTLDLVKLLPLKAGGDENERMSKFLDNGCELEMGVVIEKF